MRLTRTAFGMVVTLSVTAPTGACPWHAMGGARYSAFGPLLDEYGQRPSGHEEPAQGRSPGSLPASRIEPATSPPAVSEIVRQPTS